MGGVTNLQGKEDASELLQTKIELEKQKKALEESVLEKETALQKQIKTVGNYVDDSVPLSNNEVGGPSSDGTYFC